MDDFDNLMEIQRMTASSIRQENEVDNKIKVLDILASLTASEPMVQKEAVILEGSMQGLSESQVISTLDALKRDRLVAEPKEGFIRLI